MWITRYRGVQLASDVSPDTVDGDVITFVDKTTYDVAAHRQSGSSRIERLTEGDWRWTAAGIVSTDDRPIVDITELDPGRYELRSHLGNKILSGSHSSINIGNPADRWGVQHGSGNTQINRF